MDETIQFRTKNGVFLNVAENDAIEKSAKNKVDFVLEVGIDFHPFKSYERSKIW